MKPKPVGQKKLTSAKLAAGILLILILAQAAAVIALGTQKNSYFIDELYSYGLSNSTGGPFLRYDEHFYDQWHEAGYFRDYLAVERGESFAYAAVYRNQVLDVHPPLYYFGLHTVSSFFPGVFSKWFGIGLNILILAFCQLLLYLIARQLLDQPLAALLPGLVWGSLAAVNSALFIRMYLLLTLLALLLVYWHVQLAEKGLTPRRLAVTGLVLTLGLLTHYYLLILAAMLGLAFAVYLLARRRWQQCLYYCGAMLAGTGLFIGLFPAVIRHLFGEALVGTMTRDNLLALGQLPGRLIRYGRGTLLDLFGQAGFKALLLPGLAVGLALLILVFRALRRRRQKPMTAENDQAVISAKAQHNKRSHRQLVYGLALLFVVAATFGVIAQISVVVETRYLYFLYPLLCLGLILLLSITLSRAIRPAGAVLAVLLAVGLSVAAVAATTGRLSYLYPERTAARERLAAQYSDCDCLFLTEFNAPPSQELMELMVLRGVYITGQSSIAQLASIQDGRDQSDGLIVLVDVNQFWSSGYDADAVIRKILATGLFDTSEELYRYGLVQAFYVSDSNSR